MNGGARLLERTTPEQWISEATERWSPVAKVCLFSGGHDSTVLAHRCRDHYDLLAWIDTGTAAPGVEKFVREYAAWIEKPIWVLASGTAYRELVLKIGFPGPGQHGRAYQRLKERRIEDILRTMKLGHPRTASVLFLSGVRRAESGRRAKRMPLAERRSAKFCSPLIEWTDEEMRDYRAEHELPESDVAALLHRSGECNCGSFAAPGEREMLASLWPEWFDATIAGLEDEAEKAGQRYCRWGGFDSGGNRAGSERAEAGLLCTDCQLFSTQEVDRG